MKLLVTTSLPTLQRFNSPHLGRLFVPKMCKNVEGTERAGMTWAADNGAYSGFDERLFIRMCADIRGRAGCRFVTAPDVVGDAKATLRKFEEWEPILRSLGLPIAFVTQDGIEDIRIPWERISAIFIGGSDAHKVSTPTIRSVRTARMLGKWVHMGRVNADERMAQAHAIGCDSIDGSSFGRFPKKYLPRAITTLDRLHGAITQGAVA